MNEKLIKEAFNVLMGVNGDKFANEIITTGVLSGSSYNQIEDNVYFNGKDSITEYFGIVHWYYILGKKAIKLEKARIDAEKAKADLIVDKF